MVSKEELEKFKRPLYSEGRCCGNGGKKNGSIFDVVKTCRVEAQSRKQCEQAAWRGGPTDIITKLNVLRGSESAIWHEISNASIHIIVQKIPLHNSGLRRRQPFFIALTRTSFVSHFSFKAVWLKRKHYNILTQTDMGLKLFPKSTGSLGQLWLLKNSSFS